MATGFLWDERYAWHDTGTGSAFMSAGGLVGPAVTAALGFWLARGEKSARVGLIVLGVGLVVAEVLVVRGGRGRSCRPTPYVDARPPPRVGDLAERRRSRGRWSIAGRRGCASGAGRTRRDRDRGANRSTNHRARARRVGGAPGQPSSDSIRRISASSAAGSTSRATCAPRRVT